MKKARPVKAGSSLLFYFYLEFGISVSGTVSGNTLTVNYSTTEEAMCTCQLGSDNTPVSCKTLYTIVTFA